MTPCIRHAAPPPDRQTPLLADGRKEMSQSALTADRVGERRDGTFLTLKANTCVCYTTQESIPVGCMPPALHCYGVSVFGEGVPDRESAGQRRPRSKMQPETPPEGTWDQITRQEVTSYRDTPPPSHSWVPHLLTYIFVFCRVRWLILRVASQFHTYFTTCLVL